MVSLQRVSIVCVIHEGVLPHATTPEEVFLQISFFTVIRNQPVSLSIEATQAADVLLPAFPTRLACFVPAFMDRLQRGPKVMMLVLPLPDWEEAFSSRFDGLSRCSRSAVDCHRC